MEPCDSVDLTEVIEEEDGAFLVLRSPDSAEDKPRYRTVVEFPTRKEAEAFFRK